MKNPQSLPLPHPNPLPLAHPQMLLSHSCTHSYTCPCSLHTNCQFYLPSMKTTYLHFIHTSIRPCAWRKFDQPIELKMRTGELCDTYDT